MPKLSRYFTHANNQNWRFNRINAFKQQKAYKMQYTWVILTCWNSHNYKILNFFLFNLIYSLHILFSGKWNNAHKQIEVSLFYCTCNLFKFMDWRTVDEMHRVNSVCLVFTSEQKYRKYISPFGPLCYFKVSRKEQKIYRKQ